METRVLLTGLSSIVFVLIDSERRVRSAVSFLLIFFLFYFFYSVTLHSLFKKERKKNSHVSVATHLFKRTCPKLLLEGVNNSGYELMKYVNITRLPSGRRRERERERRLFIFHRDIERRLYLTTLLPVWEATCTFSVCTVGLDLHWLVRSCQKK